MILKTEPEQQQTVPRDLIADLVNAAEACAEIVRAHNRFLSQWLDGAARAVKEEMSR